MSKILHKEKLAPEIYAIRVEAPHIASERRPGQFIILLLNKDYGERIPLTIADADAEEGSITLVFQTVGKTTHQLAEMAVGQQIADLVGPLGKPTHVERFGTVACVAGGVGVGPLYPITRAMKEAGNRIIVILAARSRELIVWEDRMRELADEFILCTDDGSRGRKALATEPLKELCERANPPDLVIAIGPAIMMKFSAETTRPYGVPTVVSLNTIMVDGTGMCGGCRVTVGGETKFVCVDGPEFDGHLVDFDNMMNRLTAYKEQECRAHEAYHREQETAKSHEQPR
jgi:ferredoxin--NADP+ reductase